MTAEWGIKEFMTEQERALYDTGLAYAVGGAFTQDQAELVMPIPGSPAARRATQTVSEGHCTCGHDRDAHRRARCWIGWDGNPVTRKASLIACPCTGWEQA